MASLDTSLSIQTRTVGRQGAIHDIHGSAGQGGDLFDDVDVETGSRWQSSLQIIMDE